MSKFEQEAVLSCEAFGRLEVSQADFPWISPIEASIPTYLVGLQDQCTSFRMGNLISLSNGVQKYADSVSHAAFLSAQNSLYRVLPAVLNGLSGKDVTKVHHDKFVKGQLLTAADTRRSAARLVFAILPPEEGIEVSTVLRVGISTMDDRRRLLGVLGAKPVGRTKQRR